MKINIKKFCTLLPVWLVMIFTACSQGQSKSNVSAGSSEDTKTYPDAKPNSYWKKVLSNDAYTSWSRRERSSRFTTPTGIIAKGAPM